MNHEASRGGEKKKEKLRKKNRVKEVGKGKKGRRRGEGRKDSRVRMEMKKNR